jgi:hypothetical protein
MTKFTYSPRKVDLVPAFVRVIYEDAKIVEPLSKNYDGLDRKSPMKSATVVTGDGRALYTLPIKNNKLVYRRRNLARGIVGGDSDISFSKPKRCFILATEGKIAFIWDSEEIKEFTEWQNEEPYSCPNLRADEQ